MYHNHSYQAQSRRGNDEFLRRMLGGELTGSLPVMNPVPTPPTGGSGCGKPPASCPIGSMPSLAMVYSPVQRFEGLYTPEEGLQNGSLFRDLVKPFHGKWQAEGGRK